MGKLDDLYERTTERKKVEVWSAWACKYKTDGGGSGFALALMLPERLLGVSKVTKKL